MNCFCSEDFKYVQHWFLDQPVSELSAFFKRVPNFQNPKKKSLNLIVIKSLNFGCQLWQNCNTYIFVTNITGLHLFWGFQICSALISSSNGFWVISVYSKGDQISKIQRNSPNLIALKSLNFGCQLWQNYKAYIFVTSITE